MTAAAGASGLTGRHDVLARLAVAGTLALLAPIALHAYLGTFARFVGDDYCAASVFQQEGLLGGQIWFYRYWSAIPTTVALMAATDPFLTAKVSWALPAVMLALWVAAAMVAVARLSRLWRSFHPATVALTAALLVSLSIESAPHIVQSIYLRVPMLAYAAPLVAGTAFVAFLVPRLVAPAATRLSLCGSAAMAFIAGAFGPVYVALQTTVLAIGALAAAARRARPALHLTAAGLAGSIAALVFIIAAPGNAGRQSYFPPPPDWLTIGWWSVLYAGFMFARPIVPLIDSTIAELVPSVLGSTPKWLPVALSMGASPVVPLLALGLPAALAFATVDAADARRALGPSRRILIWTLPVVFVLVVACMAPGAYGTSSPPPPRALIIPNFVIVAGCMAWGGAAGTWLRATCAPGSPVPAAVVALLSALVAWHAATASASAWSRRGELQAWAARWDAADRELRAARASGNTRPTITAVGAVGGVGSLADHPDDWVNICAARYYGVEAITGRPGHDAAPDPRKAGS